MKKLMLFLMVCIPILVVLIVKLTASVAVGQIFVAVESIKIEHDPIVAKVGDELNLGCTLYPANATYKDVIWKAVDLEGRENENIAVVDSNGHVEFVGLGKGYIVASTQEGNKRDECYFSVYDTEVHDVELIAPSNRLHINDTMSLIAVVTPVEANQDVTFSSSREDIASVDQNGLVRGLAEGKTVITVTTEDGNFDASVEIFVIKPVEGLLPTQTVVKTSLPNIQVDDYIVEPFDASYKNVTFSVDNPDIAEVDYLGMLTFKRAGEVNVTIKTEDGGFELIVKYIYTAGYAYDLLLDKYSYELQVGDSVFLKCTTEPDNLYMTQLEYLSDDNDVAYVDKGGYLHAVKGGSTTIRVRVQKNETEYIEKDISVNVKSPATDIIIEDDMTAEREYQLNPRSAPEDSTNETYFYHVDDPSLAEVSESGLVTFLSEGPCTVTITINANEDTDAVSKQVHITYTADNAGEFTLLDKNVVINFGEQIYLQCEIKPSNATVKPLGVSLVSSNSVAGEGDVIEILEDGGIKAVGGGTAKVKVTYTLYDGSVVEDFCDITVLKKATSVEIYLGDLEYYNNQYVTAERVVDFSGAAFPLDATEKDIVWSVNDNIAFINGNQLIFNQPGVATLTATVGEISKSVEIYYTFTSPVWVDVKANINGEKSEIPTEIEVGQSFEIEVESIIPSGIQNQNIYVEARNQKIISGTGKVLDIQGNVVTAVAGGSATLVVRMANFRRNFEISIIRKPESISVLQANTQITVSSIELVSEVLPYDTTNQNVYYVVENTDIADVQGALLTFKQNGVAKIVAYCEADPEINVPFTIEKIEKERVKLSVDKKEATVNKGDVIEFVCQGDYTLETSDEKPVVANETVARIEDRYLRILAAGQVTVSVKTAQGTYTIKITARQPIEEIVLQNQIDFYNGEYVVGESEINLDFAVYPEYADNKELSLRIVKSVSSTGSDENIARVSGKTIYFLNTGVVTLEVKAKEDDYAITLKIRYTAGEALEAILNVDSQLVLNIGEQKEIKVLQWIPYDVSSTSMTIYEVNTSGKQIIEINNKTNTIRALSSGETKIVVELSNDIVKEITVIVANKVEDIKVEENVLTAEDTYEIVAVVTPDNATNQQLEYFLEQTEIATIEGNVVHFKTAGTVTVKVRATDDSGVEKTIRITCTMGHLSQIVLEEDNITIEKQKSVSLAIKKYPIDSLEDVKYKILSQQAADNSKNSVVQILENGQIVGLYGGTATIRVYAQNIDGEEIFADCQVTVYSPVVSIELKFADDIQMYEGVYATSRQEFAFEVVLKPSDATIKSYTYNIKKKDIAKIEDGKIIFLKTGTVEIVFSSDDNGKSKTYKFRYAGEQIIDAQLDKTGFDGDVIRLAPGENITFSLLKAVPNDLKNITFTLNNVTESRIDPSKEVARFENGTLYAENGGRYQFELIVNGFNLGRYTLEVTRPATDIIIRDESDKEIEKDEMLFTATKTYQIRAKVRETDSNQDVLGYTCKTPDIASVNSDGKVTFTQFGECEIEVYVLANPKISKTIKIKYTDEIQGIRFREIARVDYYAYETPILEIIASPVSDKEYEYKLEVDNPNASIQKVEKGYKLNCTGGDVTVTARVANIDRDISVSKTFHFYAAVKDLVLDLDANSDKEGIGGYRFFGKYFYEGNKLVSTYKLKVSERVENMYKELSKDRYDLVEWTSSSNIASVTQDGTVTFNGTGKVTITVRQKSIIEGVAVASDSYEFTVVDGINIYNLEQFKMAYNILNKNPEKDTIDYKNMVLQNNIALDKTFANVTLNFNLLGNGHEIDHTNANINTYDKFTVSKSNTVMDNVTLKGVVCSNMSELLGTKNLLKIANCENVVLNNVKLSYAETDLEVYAAKVQIQGCVFDNCLSSGISINRTKERISDVTIKDSAFANSFCGIFIVPHDYDEPTKSALHLLSNVRFYNYSTLDELEAGLDLKSILSKNTGIDANLLNTALSTLYSQARTTISSQASSFCNEGKYYKFCVFELEASVVGKKFKGKAVLDNKIAEYDPFTVTGKVTYAVININYTFDLLSMVNTKSKYSSDEYEKTNASVLAAIKQSKQVVEDLLK